MSNKLLISIYSHEDEFIELLYDNHREFEGQIMSPQITLNKNGTKELSFSMPLRIFNRSTNNFIENPRWDYIVHQYKIRVEDNDSIQEFICRDYVETRNDGNQVVITVNCMSLAEFELTQFGYSLSFSENDLNKYEENTDPNDVNNKPIGVYDGDIYFWENKLLNAINNDENKIWDFEIESYYIVDEECANDNRQQEDFFDPSITNSLHTGHKQFYENNRIIGYTESGEKIHADNYEIKKRIITEEKSSVWNIQQTICQEFECWPDFQYTYVNGKLTNRKIVLKNDLPSYGNFTIEYRKNLNGIIRTVDSSNIITKMYVNNIENENSDSGLISIADNEANFTGENYLLDLDWYLGALEDEDVTSKELINPNLSYTFRASEFIAQRALNVYMCYYDTMQQTSFVYGSIEKDCDMHIGADNKFYVVNKEGKQCLIYYFINNELQNVATEFTIGKTGEVYNITYSSEKIIFDGVDEKTYSPMKKQYLPISWDIAVNNTKNLIEEYKFNLHLRNKWIHDQSLKVTQAQEELSVLLEQLEFYNSSYESAKETYSTYYKKKLEKANDYQTITTNKDCFIQLDPNGEMYVIFSENGIRAGELEDAIEDASRFINLTKKGDIKFEIVEREEITQSVTKIRMSGLKVKDSTKAAYFTIKLTYHPLDFYQTLCEYWKSQMDNAKQQITILGKTLEDGWTVNTENDIELYPNKTGAYGQRIVKKETELQQLKSQLYKGQKEKQNLIKEIENKLSPYIREGYWEDSNYSVYPNPEKVINDGKFVDVRRQKNLKTNFSYSKDDWYAQDTYLNYYIPNYQLNLVEVKEVYNITDSAQEIFAPGPNIDNKKLYLYDIIDLDTIEVSTAEPNQTEQDALYLAFSKGIDFDVEYGECALEWEGTDSNITATDTLKGLFVRFKYDNLYNTKKWQLTANDKVFIRAKARGCDQYIQLLSPRTQFSYITNGCDIYSVGNSGWWTYPVNMKHNGVTTLVPYCAIDREYTITDQNVISDSINITIYSEQLGLNLDQQKINCEPVKYDLVYGKDFYVYKDFDDNNKMITKIQIQNSTYSKLPPIGISDSSAVWMGIKYKTDSTAHYYYNDALDVFEDYKKPEVNYTVTITDISKTMPTFASFSSLKPEVGTKVAIWDKEMHFNGNLGLIDSITIDLLNPQNTQINITSYKNKFEDLFQKITAATVAIENKEYSYDRAAEITDTTSTAKMYDLMTNALKEADEALQMSDNASISYDKKGILLESESENANGTKGKIRLTSAGIFLSNSLSETGGDAWTTAITPDFINADLLRAGHIDTRSISIWNETAPTFLWNEDGIYAYGENRGEVDENVYVKYNKDGLAFRTVGELNEPIELVDLLYNRSVTFAEDDRKQIQTWEVNLDDNQKCLYDFKFTIQGENETLNEDTALHFYLGFNGNFISFDTSAPWVSYNEGVFTIDKSDFLVSKRDSNSGNTLNFVLLVVRGNREQKLLYNFEEAHLYDLTAFGDTEPEINLLLEMIRNTDAETVLYGVKNEQDSTQTPKVYYDSVKLDWDGFEFKSLANNLTLGENGLVINKKINNEEIDLIHLGLVDKENDKYGLLGKNKLNETVFKLTEDGLELTGRFSGSELYGGSVNIGGFYTSRKYHPYNKGYNFQVDETGLLKARKFELYPRSGVAQDAVFTSVDYEQYRGAYNPSMYYRAGNCLNINGQYYEVMTDFYASTLEHDLEHYCKAFTYTLNYATTVGSYILANGKMYKVVSTLTSGMPLSNAIKKKKVKELLICEYDPAAKYYCRDTFYHTDSKGIQTYYVVTAESGFTLATFEEDSKKGYFTAIEITTYSASKTYKKGDIVIDYLDYEYAMYDGERWIECLTGYREGSNVELDRPFVKLNYENGLGSLDFYNNSVWTSDNLEQTKLAHFGEDGICLYDTKGCERVLIEQDNVKIFNSESVGDYFIVDHNGPSPEHTQDGSSRIALLNASDDPIFSVTNGELYFKLDDDFYPDWTNSLPDELKDGAELGGIKISYNGEKDAERSIPIAPIFSLFSATQGSVEMTQISTSSLIHDMKEILFKNYQATEEKLHYISPQYVSGGKITMRNSQRKRAFNISPGINAVAADGNMNDLSSVTWDIGWTYNLTYNGSSFQQFILGALYDDKGKKAFPILQHYPKTYYTDEVSGELGVIQDRDSIMLGNHDRTYAVSVLVKRAVTDTDVPTAIRNSGFFVEVADDALSVPALLFSVTECGVFFGGNSANRLIATPKAKVLNADKTEYVIDDDGQYQYIKPDPSVKLTTGFTYEIGSIGYDYRIDPSTKAERGFYIVPGDGSGRGPIYIGGGSGGSAVLVNDINYLNINGSTRASADGTCKLGIVGNAAIAGDLAFDTITSLGRTGGITNAAFLTVDYINAGFIDITGKDVTYRKGDIYAAKTIRAYEGYDFLSGDDYVSVTTIGEGLTISNGVLSVTGGAGNGIGNKIEYLNINGSTAAGADTSKPKLGVQGSVSVSANIYAGDYLGTGGYITGKYVVLDSYTGSTPVTSSRGVFTPSITFSDNTTITGIDSDTLEVNNGILTVTGSTNSVAVFG